MDGAALRDWTTTGEIQAFSPNADLVLLPGDDGTRFLSTGCDPQFLLPEIDHALADQPLIFEARVRISEDLAPAVGLLRSAMRPTPLELTERATLEAALQSKTSECDAALTARDTALAARDTALAERDTALAARDPALAERDTALAARDTALAARGAALAERDAALAARGAALAERDAALAERHAALIHSQQLSAEVRNLQAERVAVVTEYRRVHTTNESLQNRLAADEERWLRERTVLKEELDVIYRSKSWRLTAPLRALIRAIR